MGATRHHAWRSRFAFRTPLLFLMTPLKRGFLLPFVEVFRQPLAVSLRNNSGTLYGCRSGAGLDFASSLQELGNCIGHVEAPFGSSLGKLRLRWPLLYRSRHHGPPTGGNRLAATGGQRRICLMPGNGGISAALLDNSGQNVDRRYQSRNWAIDQFFGRNYQAPSRDHPHLSERALTISSYGQVRRSPMKVCRAIGRALFNQNGATAIEYGLIAALIAVAGLAGIGVVGTNLSSTFSTVANYL